MALNDSAWFVRILDCKEKKDFFLGQRSGSLGAGGKGDWWTERRWLFLKIKAVTENIVILNGYKKSFSVRICTYIVMYNSKTILAHIPDPLQRAGRDVFGEPI